MTRSRLSKFSTSEHYLFILGEHTYELVHYEQDEDRFNIYELRYDFRHSPIAIDLLSGYTVTPDMLLSRIREAEMVDSVPVEFFTRSGHGLEALAESEPMVRHDDPQEEDETDEPAVEKIVGCIETDGILWRGFADLTSEDGAAELDVDTDPKCPDCQTDMEQISGNEWECLNSNCGYSASTEIRPYKEAESLFKKHIEKILNSNDEEYTLENLIESIDGEVTGDKIWRKYHEVVDDEEVSIDCFP
jgi:hypothetical protein